MKHLLWISLLVFSSKSFAAVSGGSVGNGSDDTELINRVAWFTMKNPGTEPEIEYCIEREKSFPQSERELSLMIEKAYQQWADYLYMNPFSHQREYVGATRMVMKLREVKCTGEESLKFYFGVQNETINERKKSYIDPIAFAHRTKMQVLENSQKVTWSKGYIWLVSAGTIKPSIGYPNWRNADHLYTVLLHEIGHTLGTQHVPGTVMSEKLSDLMWKPEYKNFDQKRYMGRIDITRKLHYHYVTDESHIGGILPASYHRAEERSNEVFTALTGERMSRELTTELKLDLVVKNLGNGYIESNHIGRIIFRNGNQNHMLTFEVNSASESDFIEAAQIFMKWDGKKISYSQCMDEVRYGVITLADGQKKTLVIEKGFRDNMRTANEFLNSNITLYILNLREDFPMKQQIFYVSPSVL